MPSETRSFAAIELQNLDGDFVAGMQNLSGMGHAAVGDIGDVQQAIDAAEIDERAIFGEIL